MEAVWVALFLLAFAAALGIYVFQPLLRKEWAREDEMRARHAHLLWEKNIALQNLKELEMDYRMKKTSEEEYRQCRAGLLAQVAESLTLLDEVQREALSLEIEIEAAKRRSVKK